MPPGDHDAREQATVPDSPGRAAQPKRASVASPFDPPSQDRFEEGEELGRGGMGRVFEAHDRALDRAVAIKQSLTDDGEMLVRFEREALITAQLQHPGIVPVLDAGRDAEGRPYYVMRKIEGRPLASVVAETPGVVARLALVPNMLAAVDAVAYAHARGVIHRDLKPWNILLGPFGETFVIDWGLARDLEQGDEPATATTAPSDGLTRVGSALGTPGFMAPEQARGEPLDRRADVYALGATLAHLLVGKQPFAGIEPTAAIEAAARGERLALEFPDEVPAELRAIATKAMVPARDERYRDAGELASDLRRFLAGQLVAAHVYTVRERFARWLRKHRLVVAIATLAAIALAVISTVAIRRVIVARDEARAAQARAAERADAMLVERAYSLATSEPTYALALLKQLPISSGAWQRARAVAETAAAAGASWGLPLPRPEGFTRVVASPRGDVVAFVNGEAVYLADPSLRKPPREIARAPGGFAELEFLDDGTLVALRVAESHIVRIRPDGSINEIPAGGTNIDLLAPEGGSRVFAIVDGTLRELDPDGGPPLREIGPTTAATRFVNGTVYQSDKGMIIHVDGRDPVTVPGVTLEAYRSTANFAAGRLALFSTKEVIELALVDGRWSEHGRWQVDASHVVYRGAYLIAADNAGIAHLMPNLAPIREASLVSQSGSLIVGGMVSSDEGTFVAGESAIHALVLGRSAAIAAFDDPLFSFTKAGSYLVAATRNGRLQSWDLRKILPRLVPTGAGAQAVSIDRRRAWFRIQGVLAYFDLETGKLATLDGDDYGLSSLLCADETHALVRLDEERLRALGQPAQIAILGDDGRLSRLAGSFTEVKCTPGARRLALQLESAVEVRDGHAPDRGGQRFATMAPVHSFALTDNWLAILDTAGELTRVELATGREERFSIGAEPESFAIDPRGRLATTTRGAVDVWIDGKPRRVVEGLTIATIGTHALGFLVYTRDRAVVTIDPANRVRRHDAGEGAFSTAMDDNVIAIVLEGRVALLDLRDGSVIRLPWSASTVAVSADGTQLAWTTLASRSATYRLQVPREPREILRWLDGATNAMLDPGSTEIIWQAQKN